MNKLGHEYSPNQWRFFIDSSKLSLKAVLLHNGNELPSVLTAHGVCIKETHDNINLLEKFSVDNIFGKYVLILKLLDYCLERKEGI